MGKDKKRPKRNPQSHVLDKQTFMYYENVAKVINGELEFDSEASKASCLNAVLKSISEEGLKVSQDKTVSVIVERVLEFANHQQLRAVLSNFSQDWELGCCDRSASYVLQSLLLCVNKYLGDEEADGPDDETKSCGALIIEFSDFLKSKIAFFMQHFAASHVIRVLFEVLAGCQVSENIVRGKASLQKELKKIKLQRPPVRYLEKLHELFSCIINLPKLSDHVHNNLSNPILQTIVLCLGSLDSAASVDLFRRLLSNAEIFPAAPENGLSENLKHEIGSRLVEQLLMTAPEKIYKKIWRKHFKGRLTDIAKDPVANFVLQKLIIHARNDEQLEEMFTELSSELESILELNHFGVIVALTESSIRHKSTQPGLIKSLRVAFHCDNPPERQCKLIPLLMTLTTYEVFYRMNEPDKASESSHSDGSDSESSEEKIDEGILAPKVTAVNYHGSLMIQNLLRFANNRPIISSMFELKPVELKDVCCDSCGSYIIEVFLNTAKEKSLGMLYNKLKGFYFDLACNKCGSRTFDALWKYATLEQKCTIAKELAKHESRLKGNRFGKFIYHKCSIGHLKQRPDNWKQNLENMEKAEKKHKLPDSENEKTKKKQKLMHN